MKKSILSVIVFFIGIINIYSKDIIITGNNRAELYIKENGGGMISLYRHLKKNKEDYLWLDCGNILETNKYTASDNGASFMDLYREMGLDAVAVSNHELDFGIENFEKNSNKIEKLSVNTNLGKKYIIKKVEDLKIGIVGYTREDLKINIKKSIGDKIEFNSSFDNVIAELKEKTDIIIVLCNSFDEEIHKNIAFTEGVDYIFVPGSMFYKDMKVMSKDFKTGARLYYIPWGFTHFYKGEVKGKKINFVLIELKEPDAGLLKIFSDKLIDYKPVYTIKDENRFLYGIYSYLREQTKSDMVAFNIGFFKYGERDIVDFMRYDNALHKVRINGKEIKKLSSHKDYYLYGTEKNSKGKLMVFNKLIEDSYKYTVLVNDFTYNHRDTAGIDMELIQKNVIPSLKDYAYSNLDKMEKHYPYYKDFFENKNEIFLSFFKNDSTGAYKNYSGIAKLASDQKEEQKIKYKNTLNVEKRNSEINNYFEFSFDRLNNTTTKKEAKLYTTVKNKKSDFTVYQKIDASLKDNSAGDKPVNYKFSLGKYYENNIYAGVSYQQVFPKNGQDYNLGIQLNYSQKYKLKKGIVKTFFADLFYSNNNEEYYEVDLSASYKIPLRKRMNFEISKDYFIVYDHTIGDRAYNSEYFFGININFKNERFY